jgi:serine/threonine-protein kinase
MADTLISKLSGGEEITVRPLSAIRRYNSVEQDSLIAGRELNVEAVLDGTIQTSGERIRVSAKLLRTGDGKQLWTGQFDEKFTDIFAVQDSISERVAAALKIRFGNAEKKRPTENVEAYQLYMKGRYHALNLTRAETDKGIAYFQQAIELDPNYALSYVGLARTYLPMALTSGVPSWEVMPKAKAAALRAIEIDETLAEAHTALGYTIFWYDWNWQAAEKQYLRALEIDPNNAEAHFGYAHLLSNTARHEQAIAEIKLSRELNPVSLVTNALEGQILSFAGRSDEALDRLNRTIDLNPNFWLSHLFISDVYIEKGMHAEAITAIKKAGEISGNSQSEAYRAYALAKWGKQAEARAVLDELLKLSNERYVPAYNFAIIYNALGEGETALDYLEKAFAEKNVLMVFLKADPKWNNLRDNPRFIDLMRRMNFE